MKEVKTLSICVVAYNEENFLPNLLNDINAQQYNHELIEVVLVDSMSTDRTFEIMQKFAKDRKDFCSIKVLKNPGKVQASGWNVAISNAEMDVVVRIDAHTHVPEDFSIKVMQEMNLGEFVVGGRRPCVFEKDTKWARCLLATENSLFGSSINKSRKSEKKQYVKTMFHAAYRKEVFAKTGGFNENLLRTEDNEYHYRVRENGFKLCYNPEITSYQYARNSLKRMTKQKFGNGYWIGLTSGVCPKCLSLYHFVPFVFLLGIVLTTVLCFFNLWYFAVAMWSLYGLFALTNTVLIAFSEKKKGFFVLIVPFLFLILHTAYGLGTLVGLLKMPWKRKRLKKCEQIEKVKEIYKGREN